MKDDIEELKVWMDFIINYLFGFAIRDCNHFRLLAKLIAFLGYIDSKIFKSIASLFKEKMKFLRPPTCPVRLQKMEVYLKGKTKEGVSYMSSV
ncbi:hypothetical protein J1N35_018529 [Gossypium stocksii]|uniref:Uncharacterized protein n=1 Tax=Gossypium stocksii TaxID=47602 RepID=A0A9D3VQI2_9ROSI|nr:hypothetical protein J1N35_018529 [Gossypium stocksii]